MTSKSLLVACWSHVTHPLSHERMISVMKNVGVNNKVLYLKQPMGRASPYMQGQLSKRVEVRVFSADATASARQEKRLWNKFEEC